MASTEDHTDSKTTTGDPTFLWPSQRTYRVIRRPGIVYDDSYWKLPAKKGLHVQFGLHDQKTGDYIKVEMSRKAAVNLAIELLRDARGY